jgi:anti-sigma factor ChrR (cupin superfamily)
MAEGIHSDLEQCVIVRAEEGPWRPWRGLNGVDHRPLDLVGSEQTVRITTILRMAPGVALAPHEHPDGEELLVLEGSFSDELGTYGKGTFVFNPDGTRHAISSKEGCVMFLKLRQHPGRNRKRVVVDTTKIDWLYEGHVGRSVKKLNVSPGFPEIENIRFTKLDKGIRIPSHGHPGGNEMFILEGSIADEHGLFKPGDWIRQPAGSRHAPWTDDGCVLYVRDGHIPPRDPRAASVELPEHHRG